MRGWFWRGACGLGFLALIVLGVETTVSAGEHLRSKVHEHLWYYWPSRTIYYYIQSTGGTGLNVGPGAPLDADDITLAAALGFRAWAAQPCTDMQFLYAGIVADRTSNMTVDLVNNRNTIIFRGSDWEDTDCLDAIACTTVVTRRAAGEIIDADIDLNAGAGGFQFVLDPVRGSPAFDIQSVLTHEIGHMIGFNHSQQPDAVMWPYADWGEAATRRELFQDDIDLLCGTYEAGACTVVNDYNQQLCPPPPGACAVAPVHTEGETHPDAPLALALPLAGLLIARLARRRAARRGSTQ